MYCILLRPAEYGKIRKVFLFFHGISMLPETKIMYGVIKEIVKEEDIQFLAENESEMEISSENQKWRSGAKMIDRENRSAYDKKH